MHAVTLCPKTCEISRGLVRFSGATCIVNAMDEEQALNLARQAEYLLDQEIDRLNNLQTEDYEIIREKRLQLMKLQYQQQQMWTTNGHGTYAYEKLSFVNLIPSEIGDQNAFFDIMKNSRHVICHFYR